MSCMPAARRMARRNRLRMAHGPASRSRGVGQLRVVATGNKPSEHRSPRGDLPGSPSLCTVLPCRRCFRLGPSLTSALCHVRPCAHGTGQQARHGDVDIQGRPMQTVPPCLHLNLGDLFECGPSQTLYQARRKRDGNAIAERHGNLLRRPVKRCGSSPRLGCRRLSAALQCRIDLRIGKVSHESSSTLR